MVRRLRWSAPLLLLAVFAWFGAVACSDDAESQTDALAERLVRAGEDPETRVDALPGELPEDLRDALNPGATEDTPDEDIVSLPVHPEATLVGSIRVESPDGMVTYFVIYDVDGAAADIEGAVAEQVNESPWQTVQGLSTDGTTALRFQSTVSGDITGQVTIQPASSARGPRPQGTATSTPAAEANKTSLVYVVQVQGPPPPSEAFVLPKARAIPDGLPPEMLFTDGTPISVQWVNEPGARSYQLVILTKRNETEVADAYRRQLGGAGWDNVADEAQGFATSLEYQKDDGASQVAVAIDRFTEDESYIAVFLTVQLAT